MKKIIASILYMTSIGIFAGGFQINLQGVRATGMGGAYTGLAHGPATTYFNPGGLTNIEGHQFSLGINAIFPSISLQTDATDNINQTKKTATPIYFYYGGQITEKLYVGLGINNQFGSSAAFDDEWEGRYIIQNIGLSTFMIQPTVAYKIHEKISLGAGLVYTIGSFNYERAIPLTSQNSHSGKISLEGKGNGVSFNVGLFSKLIENDKMELGIGIDYRSGIKIKLDNGNATFEDIPTSLTTTFPETTNFSSELNLPSVTSVGLSYKYIIDEKRELTFAYDFVATAWSSYDTLSFDFENTDTPDSKTTKNWKNTTTHRLGVEYKHNQFYGRLGVAYDQTPIPDGYVSPELPGETNIYPTFGLGMDVTEKIAIDLSYLTQKYSREASYKDAGFSAKYNRGVDVLSLSVLIQL